MNDIEKRARELLAAEFNVEGREQFERGQAVVVTTASAINAIVAALTIRGGELLARGSVNLLGEESPGIVPAQELDVVPSAALGADEAGAVGIGGQGDHSVGVELAQVASEHGDGVLQANDGHVTRGTPQQTRQLVAFDSYITEAMNRIVETGEGEPVWLNRHNAEEILAAIAPQWQPIATAPKDGGPVLLTSTHMTGPDDTAVMWAAIYAAEDQRFICTWDGEPLWDATHWMPLPAEPGVTQ